MGLGFKCFLELQDWQQAKDLSAYVGPIGRVR